MSPAQEPTVAVTVDPERCVGSATCTVIAAGNFTLDEYDRSEPTAPVSTDVAAVQRAAELCPTGAIRVTPAGPAGLADPK
jgi:ferredoxin